MLRGVFITTVISQHLIVFVISSEWAVTYTWLTDSNNVRSIKCRISSHIEKVKSYFGSVSTYIF